MTQNATRFSTGHHIHIYTIISAYIIYACWSSHVKLSTKLKYDLLHQPEETG